MERNNFWSKTSSIWSVFPSLILQTMTECPLVDNQITRQKFTSILIILFLKMFIISHHKTFCWDIIVQTFVEKKDNDYIILSFFFDLTVWWIFSGKFKKMNTKIFEKKNGQSVYNTIKFTFLKQAKCEVKYKFQWENICK